MLNRIVKFRRGPGQEREKYEEMKGSDGAKSPHQVEFQAVAGETPSTPGSQSGTPSAGQIAEGECRRFFDRKVTRL